MIVTKLGGLPFLHDRFSDRMLLSGVAVVRQMSLPARIQDTTESLASYLSPETALRVRQEEGITAQIPSTALPPSQQERVSEVLDAICSKAPIWKPLFTVPLRFRLLEDDSGALGCSCYAFPQHIFLAPRAFSNRIELAEQLVHECCHNWMYMLEELGAFQPTARGRKFELPSGTSNRSVTEVIGAAHVSAALCRWYEWHLNEASASIRLEQLRTYLKGCLTILDSLTEQDITPAGVEVACRLAHIMSRRSHV